MKKLKWSAFALSLILLHATAFAQIEGVDDFLGLETELLPELQGKQKFTKEQYHEMAAWNVDSKDVFVDLPQPNKGQGYSIIPWATLDHEYWLSIDHWMRERKVKDATPDWKIRVRDAEQLEIVGKVLQCFGTCEVYRGTLQHKVQHLSRIHEGDELRTGKDSVVWVYMIDGTLMRLSADSSISLHEISISKNDIFVLARLNQGHLFWHPRSQKDLVPDYGPETDSVSLPLMVREANQQQFERKLFQNQTPNDRLFALIDLDETAIQGQFQEINKLKAENNLGVNLGSKVMIVTPNSTILSRNVSFDTIYLPGGNGYFKKRNLELGEEFELQLRGYATTELTTISEAVWHQVDAKGRNVTPLSDASGVLQVTELLTKRIKTMELAREIWMKEFTIPMMKASKTPRILAQNFGYSTWGDEISKRYDFLKEYTRRIETTNLRSMENLLTKLEDKGEKVRRDLSEDHYRTSLNHYLLGLKSRYDSKKMQVREMSDLQYYVWILKHGKI